MRRNYMNHCVPKHADLTLDMAPISRRFELVGELLIENAPHLDDAVGHTLHFCFPGRDM